MPILDLQKGERRDLYEPISGNNKRDSYLEEVLATLPGGTIYPVDLFSQGLFYSSDRKGTWQASEYTVPREEAQSVPIWRYAAFVANSYAVTRNRRAAEHRLMHNRGAPALYEAFEPLMCISRSPLYLCLLARGERFAGRGLATACARPQRIWLFAFPSG